MSNPQVSAAATGLPENTNRPSRRLFLAAGPAAAVFGSLSVAAQERSSGPLVFACRKAVAAHRAYNELCGNEDDPRLSILAEVEREGVAFASSTPASNGADVKEKALLLRAQLPQNRDNTDVWSCACEADKLTWSLIKDILALTGGEVA